MRPRQYVGGGFLAGSGVAGWAFGSGPLSIISGIAGVIIFVILVRSAFAEERG